MQHIVGIWKFSTLAIKLTDKVFIRAMHTNKQTTSAEDAIILFIYIITRQLVNLIDNQIPTTEIEITDTKIDSSNTHIGNDTLKTLRKFCFYIVVNLSHLIFVKIILATKIQKKM